MTSFVNTFCSSLALSLLPLFSVSALAQAEKKEEKPAVAEEAKKAKAPAAKEPKETKKADKKMNENIFYVTLTTTLGDVTMEFDRTKAPNTFSPKPAQGSGTRVSLETLFRKNFYEGLVFHRVIPGFMIQGGGMDAKMNERRSFEGKPLAGLEIDSSNGVKNERGTVAMARTNDPNSATSQFFINLKDNDFLNASPGNPGYSVVGKVTEGMDVIDKIAKVKTGNFGFHQDVPTTAVVIEKVSVK
jgi:peptidyl-prolyl cis-trans isomerase A (cyclophilin A)